MTVDIATQPPISYKLGGDQMTDDAELDAMRSVFATLNSLDPGARERVVSWITHRLELKGLSPAARSASSGAPDQIRSGEHIDARHETLAEAFAAASPKTGGQKALIVGYWKQVRDGAVSLDSQSINTELKHMGHHVTNITDAMNELQRQRPQLAVQLKKSGTTKQARKTYKITTEGVKVAETMIRGDL